MLHSNLDAQLGFRSPYLAMATLFVAFMHLIKGKDVFEIDRLLPHDPNDATIKAQKAKPRHNDNKHTVDPKLIPDEVKDIHILDYDAVDVVFNV